MERLAERLMSSSDQEIVARLVEHARSGSDVETMVRMLRDAGLSQVKSMRLLSDAGIMTFGEAKDVVANSPSWTDTVDAHEALVSAGIESSTQEGP